MSIRLPLITKASRIIGIPVKKWEGRCYEIANKLVTSGVINGRSAYGHYYGPVSGKGYWAKRTACEFQRHGWIVNGDGMIIDPTRWSFEAVAPYIAVISPKSKKFTDYDEGGNRMRSQFETPPPEWSEDEKMTDLVFLDRDTDRFVQDLLGYPPEITVHQALWLATLALSRLEGYAKCIYESLVRANLGAFIPWDNRKLILGV